MLIKNLQELIKLTNHYKNPYLICYYKGIDWASIVSYNTKSYNEVKLSDHLSIISCMKTHCYKIKKDNVIKVLDGSIIIDEKIIDEDSYFTYKNKIGLCKGYKDYNSFLYYETGIIEDDYESYKKEL